MADTLHQVGLIGLLFIGLFGGAWLFQRWKLPSMLAFMIAGIAFQRFTPPLLAPIFPIIGEIAIWLLFFFIGLEYSPENLSRLSRSILKPGLIDFFLNFGVIAATAAFWVPSQEAILLGAALYPSSTAIVARLLLEYGRLASAEAELLLGLLIFEDIVGVGLLGGLTPLVQEGTFTGGLLAKVIGALVGLVALFWGLHRWIVPWVTRRFPPIGEEPVSVFLTLGLVLGVGAGGHRVGLSGALTAFLLGVLIPEGSSLYQAAEKSLLSIRELSIGLFFFALSYTIDLERLPGAEVLLWLGLSFLLKGISTFWAGRVWGLRPRTALRAALSFLPKGEFSLLFGALSAWWREVIVAVVVGSAIGGTAGFAWADRVAAKVFPRRKKPKATLP
ncbi:MAG: sodium:proton antiporter [Bacteroidia bacterium]|nr:MAG: sodium:proton antiporter [Bacteroidia bacterium]